MALSADAIALSVDAIALSADAMALSVDAMALSVDAITLSVDAMALSVDAIALSVDAMALSVDAILSFARITFFSGDGSFIAILNQTCRNKIPNFLKKSGISGLQFSQIKQDCYRSVNYRYLQNAIAQVYNTTNGTGYPFENRYKISKRVFYVWMEMTEQRDADSPSNNSQQLSEPTDGATTKSVDNSWTNRIGGVWNKATTRITQLLPVEQLAQTVVEWFSVSETQVAEILEKIRAELPTTEALLIGKPQAGKSSIVRGLTGVSAKIVGQGFRPHTQHTQRYAYPSNDLPLLIFTDTVGLGDVKQDTQLIVQELVGDLQQETRSARILLLTVKINDFATDTLRQIAQQLRQKYPDIPCLLVVTCLHEVYPGDTVDHPTYPPDYEEVNRAFAAMQQAFAGISDRSVLIDFTLEEDGYTPVFYGLEALRDSLAELLPQAEAQAIYQLLDQEETGKQLGNLYRDAARRYILPFAIMSATLAAVPLPFATMPVLTALQVSMVGLLGKLYGQTLTPSQAGGVVSAIAGGFLAQAIARELIKFIPGFGSAIAASWAAAYTWALGEAACVYFGDLMGGKKPDPQKIQLVMQEAFQAAQERFKGIKH